MCPEDMIHAIRFKKFLDNRCPKSIPCSSDCQLGDGTSTDLPRTNCKVFFLWVRIGPHQVRHRTLMGDLPEPVNDLDLIDMVYGRTESSVDAKYGIIDDHAQGEKVEHVGKVLPDRGRAVFSRTLEVEAVCLGVISRRHHALSLASIRFPFSHLFLRRVPLSSVPLSRKNQTIPQSPKASEASFEVFHHTPAHGATHLRNRSRLMISSDKLDSSWIPQFEASKKRDGFDRVKTAIDIVTCNEVSPRALGMCFCIHRGRDSWYSALSRRCEKSR